MDLALTEAQEMLKNSAREFLERECPTSLVRAMEDDERGYPAQLWEQMAGLGWMGLAFPQEFGGEGGSLTDLAVLLEEMGRAMLPG
ncbi:MAG: acyl-CoA dehydrogenase family protein, partial [Chloroflexi bacterium]|nr:acyl-CoA dehydrogenase family protein [Chloroflexota bacterium]